MIKEVSPGNFSSEESHFYFLVEKVLLGSFSASKIRSGMYSNRLDFAEINW